MCGNAYCVICKGVPLPEYDSTDCYGVCVCMIQEPHPEGKTGDEGINIHSLQALIMHTNHYHFPHPFTQHNALLVASDS